MMIGTYLKSLLIRSVLILRRFSPFKGVALLTGQLSIKVHRNDGSIELYNYPKKEYNAIVSTLRKELAKHISTTGNDMWIGENGLLAGAGAVGDGIVFASASTWYDFITTLDAGGTGSLNYSEWQGIRNFIVAETLTSAAFGLNVNVGAKTIAKTYANQVVNIPVDAGEQITATWRLTFTAA